MIKQKEYSVSTSHACRGLCSLIRQELCDSLVFYLHHVNNLFCSCSMLKQRPPSGNSIRQTHKQSKEKLSQRLHEMNEQFDAIEELTNNMEQDIQQSNRVCTTIDHALIMIAYILYYILVPLSLIRVANEILFCNLSFSKCKIIKKKTE